MSKPLDGVRILDLTRLLPGGVATMMLADMGAEVIKIEDPFGGDYARWMPPLLGEMGAFFQATNRKKKSIILNLKIEDGQAILHNLVQNADVLIEGFRPNVTQRLNIDYATLAKVNPRLVYCSISGWGATGPYANKGGHDLNYVALSGLQGSAHTQLPLGGQIADVGGAYMAVMGITSALFARERTGNGDHIELSLFESAMPFSMYQFVESMVGASKDGEGSLTGGLAYYDVYYSKDDQPMSFAPLEAKFWANFCHATNKPDWVKRQTDDQTKLREDLTALFASKTIDEWEAILGDVDCCWSRVTRPNNLLDDPQIQARQMMGKTESGLPWMRTPLNFANDDQPFTLGDVPEYGAHTRSILQSAGYSDAEIDQFYTNGIAGKPSQ